jgi:hypothetical protein
VRSLIASAIVALSLVATAAAATDTTESESALISPLVNSIAISGTLTANIYDLGFIVISVSNVIGHEIIVPCTWDSCEKLVEGSWVQVRGHFGPAREECPGDDGPGGSGGIDIDNAIVVDMLWTCNREKPCEVIAP